MCVCGVSNIGEAPLQLPLLGAGEGPQGRDAQERHSLRLLHSTSCCTTATHSMLVLVEFWKAGRQAQGIPRSTWTRTGASK